MEKKAKKEKSKARKIVEWVLTGIVVALFALVAIAQVNGLMTKSENYNHSLPFGYGTFVVQTDSMLPDYEVNTAVITHKDDADSIYKLYLEYEEYNAPIKEEYKSKIESAATDSERFQIQEEMEKKTKNIDVTFADCYSDPDPKSHVPSDTYLTEETSNMSDTSGQPVVITHRLREIFVNENIEKGKGKYTFIVSGTNLSEHQSAAHQYQSLSEKELLGVVKVNSAFLGGFFSFVTSIWGLLILLLIPALYLMVTSIIDIFKALKEPDEEEEKQTANGAPIGDKPKDDADPLAGISEEDKERLKQEMLAQLLENQNKEK